MGNAVPEQTFPFWTNFPYWKALTLAYFWRSRCEKTSTEPASQRNSIIRDIVLSLPRGMLRWLNIYYRTITCVQVQACVQ